ncbi:YDG domain-containing protein [Oscillibacter sp.]|uniref:YDG domain-containing protein n=1 Tax=Oscillibacter sp. TaxID=1945593 RepID=UPI001B59B934|nr:YDG domain-containing protein [Oscillibacter sp.]MBP3509325.1 S-layer homology domain-containing protein [Oscillibacter sp.]
MKKRIISILLCLTMFVTLLPTTAWADNVDDPDPQEEVIQEQPSPEEGGPVPEEPECEEDEPAPGEDEPAPALTTPEIEERLYDEETSEMLLSVPGEWDSYAWEAYFGGEWIPCDEETSAEMVLSKEVYVQYGFRCTVTKDGQSVTSKPYAYDDAVWESSDITRYDVRNRGSDALTASSSYIKFYQNSRNRFDIHGVDNGKEFKTTFMDGGYRTAVSLDGGASKVEVSYTGNTVPVGGSLTAQTSLDIVYGGRYVQIAYKVTNSGSTTKDFRIGSSADVMIDNNDKAEVKGSTAGLTMSGSPKNSYTFNLVAPTCDTLWYGYWTQAYDNVFTNRADRNTPYNKDSGMAWSWSGSVAPGETWTRYVLIGAGELPPSPSAPAIPDLTTRTVTAGAEETFTGTGQARTTVHITVCGQEASAVVDSNGSFTAQITIPANYPDATAAVNYWATTDEGGISEMKTATVNVLRQPQVNLTTTTTTVMEEDILSESWYKGFIKSSVGNVTYTTIDTSTPGTDHTVTYTAKVDGFDDATETLNVKVLPKPAELTQTTVTGTTSFTLSATMTYTGGKAYTETGFVYGALQNPTLALNDGKVTISPAVNTKGGTLSATLTADQLTEGITYYARAYAKCGDTVIYGAQSTGFGLGAPSYGAFSVTNNGNTFTITRIGGSSGKQTVYYRTVNGSAIGGTHFTHAASTLTFAARETSKTVTVTENAVTSIYGGKAATAYSNADRTYSLEIYRVEGGATIGTSTATRTMTMDSGYSVDRKMFNQPNYATVGPSGQTQRGDYNDDHLGWADSNNVGSAAKETIDIPFAQLPNREYWANVGYRLGYQVFFTAWETNDGYQHIQITPGDALDTAFYPYEGKYKDRDSDTVISSLNDAKYKAIYAVTFEHGGSGQSSTKVQYSLPGNVLGYGNANFTKLADKTGYYSASEKAFLIPFDTEKITLGFGGSGSNNDKWYTDQIIHRFKVIDNQEPQLIGIAPMAGGTYLPGDKVTVSLVFDEIVDSTNSGLNSNSTITTNWGTFTYAGGADTNVLYFTGTVPENVSGPIRLIKLNCASQIKDMCDTAETASSGSGSSDVTVGSAAKPTVSVGAITNSNGTLTATITAANAGKLEYVWSTEPTAPAYGWKMLTNTSSATVTTRQTSGTWYLHARATNSDGWVVYDCKSYTFSGSTVILPDLTVSVDNTSWAKEREITLTKTPSSAAVTVSGPGITGNQTVSGTTYTAKANGVYTFTLTSGSETVTKTATVSKLDTTAPTVTVHDLANRNHTEAVTLTVTAADTESGVSTVTGTWSNGSSSQNAAITANGDGTWTTTSPDVSGTWTLSVTATDTVGNSGTVASAAYTINATRPTLTVTKQSETTRGVTYSYSVADNGNTGVTVQLPDGTTTTETSGTFTITEPGTYTISVTDDAGHFVSQTITVAPPSSGTLDGVKPDVRCDANPWTWTNGDVTVTVNIYEAGSTPTAKYGAGSTANTSLTVTSDTETGSYTASFTATANGTYTVTATDAAGNVGTATVVIDFIDKDNPTMTATGIASGWTSTAQTVTLTAADAASGVKSVEYAITDSNTVVPADLTALPESKQVTVSGNGTHYIYYKVTDNAGNVLTDRTNAIQINTVVPELSITGGTSGAESLTLTPVISGTDAVVTVSKDGGAAQTVTGSSYTIASEGTYTFTATSNAGLTATKTVTVYAVTFGNTGGSDVAKQLVVSGGTATSPTPPTQTGYTFSGWQKDGSTFDFGTAITSNTALTAVWTLDAPTVTLGADKTTATYNGGSTVITLTANAGHAASDLTYTYEWYKGGTKLDGQTASTLELKTVADSGSYTVKVTASKGGLTSNQIESSAVPVSITKATPSISTNPTASAVTYGQSLSNSTLSGGTAKNPNNTALTVFGTFTWTASSTKPAVSDSGSTAYSVTFTPDDVNNYNSASTTVTLTVDRKELTPSVSTVNGKTYDGNTATTGTLTLSGAVNGENPAATGIIAFTDKNVGMSKTVNVSSITLTNGWDANYQLSVASLSNVATTAEITAKTVGLTWSGHENLTYTGNAVSVTAEATELIGEDACTVTVSDGDKTDAGTYTAKATALSNSNYKLPTAVAQSYTIAKAPVSFTVSDNDLIYDSTNRTATVTQTAGQTPSVSGQFTVSYKQNGVAATPNAKGTYDVWVSLDSANFKFVGQEDTTRTMKIGTLTISASSYPNEITWPTAAGLTYGQPLSASNLTSTETGGTFAWKTDSTIPTVSNNGYTVVFTPTDTSYNSVEKTVSITVAPKELTITGAAATGRDYEPGNTTVAVSGGTLESLVIRDGVQDTVTLVSSGASGTVATADAGQNKPVTVTGYSLTGTAAGNYTLTQPTDVKVTITPAVGGGSVTMAGWTYDGTAKNSPVPTSEKNGIANVTYRYTNRAGTPSYDSAACPTDVGDYTVTATFAATNNYQLATDTADFTIRKATPTVSTNPTASAITYGQSLSDSNLSDGTAKNPNNTALTVSGTFTWTASSTKPAVSDSGTTGYSVTFTPDDADNYNPVTTTVTLTVNKAVLIPSVNTVSGKEYDGTAAATGTLTLSGAANDEHPTASGTFAFTDKAVGTNKAVNVSGITLTNGWDANYQLSTASLSGVSTTAEITAKTVGLAWSGHEDLTYTGSAVSVTAEATGLVSGDTCTVTVTDGAQTNAGTYIATAESLSNPNYKLPDDKTQNYTIAKAPVSFTVTNNAYTYDGTDKAATVAQTAGQTTAIGGRFTVSYKQSNETVTPKNAGTYEVWVTLDSENFKFAGQAETTRSMKVGELTINKKAALAVWTNLTQVYDGTPKTPTVTLVGRTEGDGSSFTVSTATNAGTHTVTLIPGNPAAESYAISNPTATLTIQKAPVTFSVTDNSVLFDGNAHVATVTASPAVAHTVTYRQNGQTVAAPTEAGTYEVWAEITDANYRHADAADGGLRKIGVLTIYRQAAPTTYTATFAGGEGATGTAPTPQSGLQAGSVLVLPNAGGLTKADHAFAGWKLGNAVYQSGETYTMPAGNITFTAQWKTNVYTISGVVNQNNQPIGHVTVTLMLGGQQIAETVTDSNGEYTFSGVIPGIYNLVASRNGVTVTIKVEITNQNASANIQLPAGKTNSIVEVKPGAATAVVGNLETVFTDNTIYTEENQTVVAGGGSVEIKLTVDKTELTDEQTRDMQNKAGGYTLGQELALTVEKTVTESGNTPTTTNISDTGVLLETTLLLPAALQGKDSYTVLRLHDGAVHTLTTSPNADGEFFEVSADKTAITIHARYYSAYVIAWRQYSSGGGGGGSASYPIALPDSNPDGGKISVSPKSATKGSTVTITVDPDDGYELDKLTVKDKNGNKLPVTTKGNGKYTFEMPSGGVTIEAAFKESVWNRNYGDCLKDNTCPIWPYTDARMTDWYHDGVHFCLENGLMVGYGDGIFKPNAPTTRSMLIVMLWRLNGSPTVNYALDFEDVKEGAWYTEAVRWAKSEGVAGGYGNGKFGPSDTLTREQMVTMLYRYAQYKGYDVSVGEDTNILSYGDATTVAEYAVPAMQWACGSGVVGGMDAADGSGLILAPKGSTTRAQIATMMMRFCAEIVK